MSEQSTERGQRRLDVGARIRRIRKERGLTITQVGQASGLSQSFISQVERDMTMPSVRTLQRLADSLDININELLADERGAVDDGVNGAHVNGAMGRSPTDVSTELQSLLVRRNSRTVLIYHGSPTRYELLAPELKSDVEFLWVKAQPGTSNAPHPFRHGGRECGVVIKGRVEFRAGDDVHVLEPGDSIYLGEGVEHEWRVLGDEAWEAVWVIL